MELMTKREATTALKDEPWSDDGVHQPYSAFNQGFDAYLLKIEKCKNPYCVDQYARWWSMGWEEAQSQEAKGQHAATTAAAVIKDAMGKAGR